MNKSALLFLLIIFQTRIFSSGSKILCAAPFVVSNYVLSAYCLSAIYTDYKKNEKITQMERYMALMLVGASVISVSYSTALIIDNLN